MIPSRSVAIDVDVNDFHRFVEREVPNQTPLSRTAARQSLPRAQGRYRRVDLAVGRDGEAHDRAAVQAACLVSSRRKPHPSREVCRPMHSFERLAVREEDELSAGWRQRRWRCGDSRRASRDEQPPGPMQQRPPCGPGDDPVALGGWLARLEAAPLPRRASERATSINHQASLRQTLRKPVAPILQRSRSSSRGTTSVSDRMTASHVGDRARPPGPTACRLLAYGPVHGRISCGKFSD
ncbi:hypothetical protein Sthe_3062 [Sphaerobacter thermophilus DSM 20745]|uniref:Uncharacterized protein n=1 Tax=Sphaerobacter thermophilus (strain ATCC 49802 / DSM 20745 / KCCM 41009 / NCIMB 13125 / S 6022) TaxID=479434 RepID=D1C9H0_SPHTD|nr:hypothetical protein Sthe_3062 [Sphaerobacter thermophilus DSM 20745]